MFVFPVSNAPELAPAGDSTGRWLKLIDLGTQTSTFNGKTTTARKLMASWELLGDHRKSDGSPFVVSKIYTSSLHERASLRKDLEASRGEPLGKLAHGFDVQSMLGQYCRVWVQHSMGSNGMRATVANVMPLPNDYARPEPVNAVETFTLHNPDFDVFLGLSQRVRNMIENSPEWKSSPATQDWVSKAITSKVEAARLPF
ncbi:phage replication initiation protein, NGO0469 family [Ralstonia nicotianae]